MRVSQQGVRVFFPFVSPFPFDYFISPCPFGWLIWGKWDRPWREEKWSESAVGMDGHVSTFHACVSERLLILRLLKAGDTPTPCLFYVFLHPSLSCFILSYYSLLFFAPLLCHYMSSLFYQLPLRQGLSVAAATFVLRLYNLSDGIIKKWKDGCASITKGV